MDFRAAFDLEIAHGEQPTDGPARIIARGELDSGSSPRLLEAFQQVTSGSGHPDELTLDLSEVNFIDSTGMRSLIEIEQDAQRRDVSLIVVSPPERVGAMLRMSGVAERVRLVAEGEGSARRVDFLERVEVELPSEAQAPFRARGVVRESLAENLDESALDSVVLMTSELVTNAVIHPPGQNSSYVCLRLTVWPDTVRVEVDDSGPGFDPAQHVFEEGDIPGPGEGGRGLFVVDRCASRWGSRTFDTDHGPRFSIWFEIATA